MRLYNHPDFLLRGITPYFDAPFSTAANTRNASLHLCRKEILDKTAQGSSRRNTTIFFFVFFLVTSTYITLFWHLQKNRRVFGPLSRVCPRCTLVHSIANACSYREHMAGLSYYQVTLRDRFDAINSETRTTKFWMAFQRRKFVSRAQQLLGFYRPQILVQCWPKCMSYFSETIFKLCF